MKFELVDAEKANYPVAGRGREARRRHRRRAQDRSRSVRQPTRPRCVVGRVFELRTRQRKCLDPKSITATFPSKPPDSSLEDVETMRSSRLFELAYVVLYEILRERSIIDSQVTEMDRDASFNFAENLHRAWSSPRKEQDPMWQ